jgi:hypothetical protein
MKVSTGREGTGETGIRSVEFSKGKKNESRKLRGKKVNAAEGQPGGQYLL